MSTPSDYQRIATAIEFLRQRPDASLAQLAQQLGLSPGHCHKLFHRWAGITPKQFQRFLHKDYALAQLRRSQPVLEASWNTGLSGSGRLHDLVVHWEAVTPGEYRRQGRGLTLRYGIEPTPLGPALLALSERGLCHLSFVLRDQRSAWAELKARWPAANWREDPRATSAVVQRLFPDRPREAGTLPPLHLWGTAFQHKVWEALLKVPEGSLCTYGQLARASGSTGAARAVGRAVGANPISMLIPCHRVIRRSGEFGQYRWGSERKIALLARECPMDVSPEQPDLGA